MFLGQMSSNHWCNNNNRHNNNSNNNDNTNSSNKNNNSNSSSNSGSATAAAVAAAVAANMHALLGSPFNYNMPSTRADYTNLALWNQLTPTQRLMLTQQMKGVSAGANGGSNSGGSGGSVASTSPKISHGSPLGGSFPALPSLPLDTDLITMLDYNNPNKQTSNKNSSSKSSGASGGTFTKPTVPPLISDEHQHQQQLLQQQQQQQQQHQPAPPTSRKQRGGGVTTIPLNSTQALEDFEKKFNMTDEMRAVIHKVIANPDLSTSIQTNANNSNNNNNNSNSHPLNAYISPPMSPAIGGANVTTLSLASNPNVTITPQLPGHFLHSPSSSCSSSSASTTAASPLGNSGGGGSNNCVNGGAAGGARQKSVICSTKANALPLAILSLAGNGGGSVGSGGNSGGSSGGGGARHNKQQQHSQSISGGYGRQSHSHQPFSISGVAGGGNCQLDIGIASTTITPSTTPTDVIDLSSSRRSLAASTFHQQQQQAAAAQQQQQAVAAQHQRMSAALAHHAQHLQQNGGHSGGGSGGGGSSASNGGSSSGGNSNSNANSASMHLQRHAALAAAACANASGDGAHRLSVIPEIQTSNMNPTPYKVRKVCVDKHLVPCINMKAYNESEQLMTLTEFQKNFFPTVALDHCKRLIEALGVELYKANRRQVQILMEHDRSYNENMPLVQVRDIIKYMTQLTFMTRQSEQPPSKRTRTS
ncbi:homeobox protein 5 isoform X6 [Drosophila navojoa]|uniref:homeobox protein 5 isoform X6 n=1 Tax=Drosophila navojoa TaxID=7232 RepID=UPI0011BDD3ED|nr:homeobox protein 5 isoform X6 [Drosophila navojoa]